MKRYLSINLPVYTYLYFFQTMVPVGLCFIDSAPSRVSLRQVSYDAVGFVVSNGGYKWVVGVSLSSHKERSFAGYVEELSHSIVCVDFKVRVVIFSVFVFPVLSMEQFLVFIWEKFYVVWRKKKLRNLA